MPSNKRYISNYGLLQQFDKQQTVSVTVLLLLPLSVTKRSAQ